MFSRLFLWIFIPAVFLMPHNISAQTPATLTVTVIGNALIHGGDVPKAREAAISNALGGAVDRAAVEILPADIFAGNFDKLNEILCVNPTKFVQTYKVLAESQAGKAYRIMMEVTVLTDSLNAQKAKLARIAPKDDPKDSGIPGYPAGRTDSGIPSAPGQKPGVLFLIAEQNLSDESPQYWWGENLTPPNTVSENAMTKTMKAKGFVIVPHGYRTADGGTRSSVGYKPDLDNQEAVDIGSRLKADVVIVGKSIVYNVGEQSFSGTVSARAVRTDTGEEISSTLQTAIKTDEEGALAAAGELAAAELSAQIAKASQSVSQNTDRPWKETPLEQEAARAEGMLELSVSGTDRLGNFVKFRRTLAEMPMVKDIKIREMRSNEALISVELGGSTREFTDALTAKSFQLFTVRVYDASGDALKIDLIPK